MISSTGLSGVTMSCSIVPASLSLMMAIEVIKSEISMMTKATIPGTKKFWLSRFGLYQVRIRPSIFAYLSSRPYEVDPLVCPKCQGTMRIISFIEAPSVIRDILNHLGLWLVRARPPPKIHDPPVCIPGTGRSAAPSIADDVSQIPVHDDHFYGDPQYSWDDYIQA